MRANMKHIVFKSSYYCIAFDLLCDTTRKWSSWMFPGFKRTDIIDFFYILRKTKILERKYPKGRMSASILKDPECLLNLCLQKFRGSERKVFQFMSKRSHEEIIKDMKMKKIEFYLGRFSGVRSGIRDVVDNKLTIIMPARSYFEGSMLKTIQLDLGIGKVPLGGEIFFIYPRYINFLRYKHQIENGVNIPSDFYTYLSMASSTNPIAKHQAEHIANKLRGKNGNFLSWE